MIRRQVSLRIADRDRLLRAHYDRIGKAAQQHDQAKRHVHDADALVVDAGQPLAPQIWPPSLTVMSASTARMTIGFHGLLFGDVADGQADTPAGTYSLRSWTSGGDTAVPKTT